jgi:hypothetical protein
MLLMPVHSQVAEEKTWALAGETVDGTVEKSGLTCAE